MKNKLKSVKRGSKTAADSQPKTAQRKAMARPSRQEPLIALFPEGDDSASEELVDLSKAEYAALKRAAGPGGAGVLMFMANAALEKARWAAVSSPSQPLSASASMGGHHRLEYAVYEAVAALMLVSGKCAEEIKGESGSVYSTYGAGIVNLAHKTAYELNIAFNEAWEEWHRAWQTARLADGRRAA
jgi:hypothetical protein